MPVIKLASSSGDSFSVEVDIVKRSNTMKDLLETCDNAEEIPLLEVNTPTLARVIEWMTRQHNHQLGNEDNIKEWVVSFLEIDQGKAKMSTFYTYHKKASKCCKRETKQNILFNSFRFIVRANRGR